MHFVILGFDGPDGAAKRTVHRPAHLAKLEALQAQRRLLLAGPLTDGAGSLMVIAAESFAEAEALVKEDPYTIHGIFERVEIHPFSPVFYPIQSP
ncbi:YciI family protein [Candidatus Nitrospira bockiana]